MLDLNHPEAKKEYFQELVELLDKYEDGWNVFINADKAKDFDYPVTLKKEYENDPYLPKRWLTLADKVISIIAHKKYELSTGPNRIEIVRADQMLDAYVRPIPDGPAHWSYGKQRVIEDKKYDANAHLAYEIIINSNPAIAYCMDTNSPVMQMLVFAHASYGHNTVYKNNYLFKDSADPDNILITNKRLREAVEDADEKYSVEEVEQLLDFCNSMRFIDTTDQPRRKKYSDSQLLAKAKKAREDAFLNPPRKKILTDEYTESASKKTVGLDLSHPASGERNILRFIADHGHHIPEWKREIMRLSADISQHFKPGMATKLLHEGFASMTHYQIMETMFDIGLMNAKMHGEFRQSHSGVVYQPPGWVPVQNPYTGEEEEKFIGSQINVYALGFAIFEDVKRICENPDEEDKKWFPTFAGKNNWVELSKHIIETCNDETLVEQYMSPKVMRKFKYFLLEGDFEETFDGENSWLEVTAVHDEDGFRRVRAQLAADYRIADKIPKVSLRDFQEETDRCLVLQHDMIDRQPLDAKSARQVLELIHAQTQHPVILESVDENGEVAARFSSPENYGEEYSLNRRTAMHYTAQ